MEQTTTPIPPLLQNQVAIITGGTAGIGKSCVLTFAQAGATVFAIGTNADRGKELVEEAKKRTGRDCVHFAQVDVTNKSLVDAAINDCLQRFQKIDILLNNAGITKDGLLMKMSEEDWDRVLEVNLKSCFFTCQAVIRSLIRARRGKIINVSSVVGLIGNPGQTNYAASKAGLIGFSKSLAREVASRNVTVNCICPGYIDTDMTKKIDEGRKADVLTHIPLGRMGTPEEVAQAALFLASDFSSYITGQVITVDGGLAM